jgi:hypothetical protein
MVGSCSTGQNPQRAVLLMEGREGGRKGGREERREGGTEGWKEGRRVGGVGF